MLLKIQGISQDSHDLVDYERVSCNLKGRKDDKAAEPAMLLKIQGVSRDSHDLIDNTRVRRDLTGVLENPTRAGGHSTSSARRMLVWAYLLRRVAP